MNTFYPVEIFADFVSFHLLRLGTGSVAGEIVHYFIYDSIKIAILLIIIVFVVTFLRSYLPPQKIKKILSHRFEFLGNILAALFGIITPFCSCSAVPLFIGFVESGVPLGVTFSYLVSAPMVNEVAAVLLLSLFGWKIALIYIVSGVAIAILTGIILGRMKLESLIESSVFESKQDQKVAEEKKNLKRRALNSWKYTARLFRRVFPYILLGVGVGALIHGYAPENLLAAVAGKDNFFAVPIAVLIGVPLYSNAAGTVPIVLALIEKGLPLGTALAFMMAVTALSLPEMIILREVLKPKLLAIYIVILSLGIIFTGYLFNFIL